MSSLLLCFVAGHDALAGAGNSTSAHWNATSRKEEDLAGRVSHHQVAEYATHEKTLLRMISRILII